MGRRRAQEEVHCVPGPPGERGRRRRSKRFERGDRRWRRRCSCCRRRPALSSRGGRSSSGPQVTSPRAASSCSWGASQHRVALLAGQGLGKKKKKKKSCDAEFFQTFDDDGDEENGGGKKTIQSLTAFFPPLSSSSLFLARIKAPFFCELLAAPSSFARKSGQGLQRAEFLSVLIQAGVVSSTFRNGPCLAGVSRPQDVLPDAQRPRLLGRRGESR